MPIVEPDFAWNLEALIEKVDCPCCGHDVWTHIPGYALFCENCNTRLDVEMPNSDGGYYLKFDDETAWSNEVEKSFPTTDDDRDVIVSAKFLSANEPGLEWFSVMADDGEELDWEPVGEKLRNPREV